MVLEQLSETEGPTSLRELSERVAERETETTPAPRDIRRSVYVSLQQTHLPKLDELGIIDYDSGEQMVELDQHADELTIYMEFVPTYGISWAEYYAAVSLIGLLGIAAAQIGVPVLGGLSSWLWGLLVLVLVLGSAVYQMTRQRSSILHRLQD